MILVCGDALIDFMPVRLADGRRAYLPAAGGSCANLATAIGRLGGRVAYMGGLSTDFFGDMLLARFSESNVDTSYVARLDRDTTLAFVKLGDGDPEYAFYDRETAGRMWTLNLSPPPGDDVALIHIGSVTLIHPPVADASEALFAAGRGRRLLSIDPNCRPGLATDAEGYRARLNRLAGMADLVKLSLADLAFMRPGLAPEAVAAEWLGGGAALVVVTKGADGATAYLAGGDVVDAPATPAEVVDTVGAGDTFLAGLLTRLQAGGRLARETLAALGPDEAAETLAFAARAAAISCGRQGCDPPWAGELQRP